MYTTVINKIPELLHIPLEKNSSSIEMIPFYITKSDQFSRESDVHRGLGQYDSKRSYLYESSISSTYYSYQIPRKSLNIGGV
jgi:hypothetical protein